MTDPLDELATQSQDGWWSVFWFPMIVLSVAIGGLAVLVFVETASPEDEGAVAGVMQHREPISFTRELREVDAAQVQAPPIVGTRVERDITEVFTIDALGNEEPLSSIGTARQIHSTPQSSTAVANGADPYWLTGLSNGYAVINGRTGRVIEFSLGAEYRPTYTYEQFQITAVASDLSLVLLRLQRFDERDPIPDFHPTRTPYVDREFLLNTESGMLSPTEFLRSELVTSAFGGTPDADQHRVLYWDRSRYFFVLQELRDGGCADIFLLSLQDGSVLRRSPETQLGEQFGCATVHPSGTELLIPSRSETGGLWVERIMLSTFPNITQTFDLSTFVTDPEELSADVAVAYLPGSAGAVIGVPPRLLLLDFMRGHRRVLYEDQTQGLGFQFWDAKSLLVTPDGQYITFLDFQNAAGDPLASSANTFRIRVIDLVAETTTVRSEFSEATTMHGWTD